MYNRKILDSKYLLEVFWRIWVMLDWSNLVMEEGSEIVEDLKHKRSNSMMEM
jgi:hypothetical protein